MLAVPEDPDGLVKRRTWSKLRRFTLPKHRHLPVGRALLRLRATSDRVRGGRSGPSNVRRQGEAEQSGSGLPRHRSRAEDNGATA
jgi:hypothetical protein